MKNGSLKMKRAIKSLFRKGQSNFTKILCLSIGLAIGLTMLAEVIYERSADSFIPRLEDTYQIQENYKMKGEGWHNFPQCSGAHAPGIKSVCPEVEAATRYTWLRESATFVTEDNEELTGNTFLCDSSFFDVFPRKVFMGEDPKTGLNKTGQAYISEKLFKTVGQKIIGKTISLRVNKAFRLTVIGVFEDLPENTHLNKIDIMVAMPTAPQLWGWDSPNNIIGNDRYLGYIRLRHGTNPDDLQGRMDQWIEDRVGQKLKEAGTQVRFNLQPVKGIYLQSDNNRVMNFVFLGFGIIMLLVSVFNYILLVISSMVNRAKSIATYRCYGAESKDIYKMILSESFLHIFCISLPLAILLIFGSQNILQEQIGHSLKSLFPFSTVIVCILITLAIIGICGWLPGYLYTKIPLTYAYRRYTENKRRWKLALLFVQFLMTSFFISILVVIGLQYNKLTNYNLGFNYKNTLMIDLDGVNKNERERCYQELKKDLNVSGVTWATHNMADIPSGDNVWNAETNEEYTNISNLFSVGDDFFHTFEIPVVEGRTFTPVAVDSLSKEVMVDRDFVKKMEQVAGWKGSAIGKTVHITSHRGPYTIIGIYDHIQTGSLTSGMNLRPTVMYYGTINSPWIERFYVRLNQFDSDHIQRIQQLVDNTIKENPKQVLMLRMEIGNNYDQLKHVRNSVLFAGISILLIALAGLIAYILDEVGRRRSEIAIRAIFGATLKDLQKIFQKNLIYMAVPGILIGALAAWKVSQYILQMFSVKIDLTWYLFVGCMLFVLLVVLSVASMLVYRAARANPTENLRTE